MRWTIVYFSVEDKDEKISSIYFDELTEACAWVKLNASRYFVVRSYKGDSDPYGAIKEHVRQMKNTISSQAMEITRLRGGYNE